MTAITLGSYRIIANDSVVQLRYTLTGKDYVEGILFALGSLGSLAATYWLVTRLIEQFKWFDLFITGIFGCCAVFLVLRSLDKLSVPSTMLNFQKADHSVIIRRPFFQKKKLSKHDLSLLVCTLHTDSLKRIDYASPKKRFSVQLDLVSAEGTTWPLATLNTSKLLDEGTRVRKKELITQARKLSQQLAAELEIACRWQ